MDTGRFAGIIAEQPTEWIAVSNPGAGNQRFCNYVYMYMSALLCNIYALCTRMHYAAIHVTCVLVGMWLYIHVNRPSGISQAAAIAVNRDKGVK